jgi:hypothetical protein
LYFSSCCSRSVCDLRVRPTRVLTFVPLERGLRTPVLFAPLRDKVTPFLSLVDLCWLLSFDHLVGAGEQRRRRFKAERLGSPEIDHQIEFGRPLDGQIARLLAL